MPQCIEQVLIVIARFVLNITWASDSDGSHISRTIACTKHTHAYHEMGFARCAQINRMCVVHLHFVFGAFRANKVAFEWGSLFAQNDRHNTRLSTFPLFHYSCNDDWAPLPVASNLLRGRLFSIEALFIRTSAAQKSQTESPEREANMGEDVTSSPLTWLSDQHRL